MFSNICHVITKCKSSCISMYKYVHGMAIVFMTILSWYNILIIQKKNIFISYTFIYYVFVLVIHFYCPSFVLLFVIRALDRKD